jgi:cytochrome oxidase assembly protein ShyY1
LLYAVQWFLFGVLGLGGYVVLARREAADRRVARPRQVMTVEAR